MNTVNAVTPQKLSTLSVRARLGLVDRASGTVGT
jgi:hypothetical protein